MRVGGVVLPSNVVDCYHGAFEAHKKRSVLCPILIFTFVPIYSSSRPPKMMNRSLPRQMTVSQRSAQRSAPRPVSRSTAVRVSARFWGKPAVDKEAVLAEVSTQFGRWNAALQTRDPKKVAAL